MGGIVFLKIPAVIWPFQKHLQDSAVQPADANIPEKLFFLVGGFNPSGKY